VTAAPAATAAERTRSPPADPRAAIRERALALGFDAIGFARPDAAPTAREDLAEYLRQGYHGDMGWLQTRAAERADPATLWPDVRSIVVLGLNYAPEADPLDATRRPDRGAVSVYAQGRDYHDVVKTRLKALARWIAATWPGELKVFVDTAPVMEKPLGQAAGLGWQGKHTNLVSRRWGSWLFLGEIYLGYTGGRTFEKWKGAAK
jgi:epoxyqueuosine reductase